MSILIHTCCADCLLHLVEGLENKKFVADEKIVYFDNPNIHPRSEMVSRLGAVKKIAPNLGITKVIVADWEPGVYFQAIGLNRTKPLRCNSCIKLRVKKLVEKAKMLDIKLITSTMLTSNYINSKLIEEYAGELVKQAGMELVIPKRCEERCQHKGFYKQNYCGCVYSLRERMEEKYSTPESHRD